MDRLFLTILNMSLTGAFIIAAICLARLPLKKAPKIISYCLWAAAGFRLIFPLHVESAFSLIPFRAQPIPLDIAMQATPRIDAIFMPSSTLTASVNPLQVWTIIGAYVWLFGAAVLLIYGMVSYRLLRRGLRGARPVDGTIYEADNILSPFVLGVINPGIYLPVGLSAQEKGYILLHERTHLRRHDHLIKFFAYFILCLHWFNPLVWVAFRLMAADMEMSCDERVLKEMGSEIKKAYSLSLLSLAARRSTIGGSPLAFGEGSIKERVKNVLNFKKPSRIIVALAVALAVLLSVGFALNRPGETPRQETVNGESVGGLAGQYGTLIEDDRAIHVMGRKAVHMTLASYDAWVAAGEDDADVYDYAECVIYTPVGEGADGQMYMTIENYKAWAAAGENDADVSHFAVPYDGE